MARKPKYDSTKLLPGQREAAVLLTEFQFKEKGEREFRTLEEIADHLGVTRMTLYRWRTQDENFIALVNDLGERYMDTKTNEVYNAVVGGAISGNAKLIEIFLKNRGLLTDRVEVTDETSGNDIQDRTSDLERRMAELLGEDTGGEEMPAESSEGQ